MTARSQLRTQGCYVMSVSYLRPAGLQEVPCLQRGHFRDRWRISHVLRTGVCLTSEEGTSGTECWNVVINEFRIVKCASKGGCVSTSAGRLVWMTKNVNERVACIAGTLQAVIKWLTTDMLRNYRDESCYYWLSLRLLYVSARAHEHVYT